MSNISFLGTGLLGSAFAEAAAERGDNVTVWNRTIEKARPLEAFGIRVAPTPADAVRGAERVHLVLKDDPVVEEVIRQLRPGLSPSAIIIDHSTTQPKATAERATRLNGEGVKYLHCPVFIGPVAARQAKGAILASGPRALFDSVHDALSRQAERVMYFGERPDLAAVFKLCGNAFIIGINAVIADAFAVAKGADVDPAQVLETIDFFNPSAIIAGRGKNMIAHEFTPTFELTMARKDVRLMLETAGLQPLSALQCIARRMDALIEQGHGASDLAILAIDSVKET
jgi:3-hydroxyisobutyrate dehydrogenase-like beta-hydroxyacid dehydrogenase